MKRSNNNSKKVALSLIPIFTTALCFFTADAAAENSKKCSADILKQLSTGSDQAYLADVFEALAGEKNPYKTPDDRYVLSVCEKATTTADRRVSNDHAGLIDVTNGTVIGRYDDLYAEVVVGPEGGSPIVHFRYNNGDACKSSSSNSKENAYGGTVIAICEAKMKQPQLSVISRPAESICSRTFVLATNSFCNITRPAHPTKPPAPAVTTAAPQADENKSSQHMNPLSGFLVFLLALGVGYCVFGFLYKRYVLGARGAEQVPNYLFWLRSWHTIQDCISNRPSPTNRQYTASASRSTDYDRAPADGDVGLMMNGGDEDRRDNEDQQSPPLVVVSGGGGPSSSSTFRQQQLNVASSNSARQQQQPLLDEADDRPLQL